eukprot:4202369-Pyramimonas_sp.AAC.1
MTSQTASDVDQVKRADGALKGAVNRHGQLVEQVIRLRRQLATAEKKVQEAALEVAKCESTKRAATAALAKAEGFRPTAKGDDTEPTCFGPNMNEELF